MTSSVRSFAGSEDDDSSGEETAKVFLKGVLSKWTNYYHGWQERYICCQNGTICYYRNLDEVDYGCRGSISLVNAVLTLHEYDPCRFDLSINDSFWYLRAESESERQQWIDVIQTNKAEADTVSLRSEYSSVSFQNEQDGGVDDKVLELKSFKGILNKQMNSLISYFETKAGYHKNANLEQWMRNGEVGTSVDADITMEDELTGNLNGASQVDLKGEVMTFKATASGIQSTLSHCIDLLVSREEMWRQKCEGLEKRLKEEEKKSKILKQERNQNFHANLNSAPEIVYQRDDDSESVTSDDEFYEPNNNFDETKTPRHRFSDKLDEKIREHLQDSVYCSKDEEWETLVDDGNLQLHRKELVKNGVVCDPIKVCYNGNGVTAKELCHYFWESTCRRDWDTSIESFDVLETLDDITVVGHQVHVQMWPIAQRDCLYVSTILKVEDAPQRESPHHDTWMVCSTSVDHPKAKLVNGRIRAQIEVALICQTHITSPSGGGPITRDCLKTDMTYIANIDPGGWAPASVLRTLGKREYPKFMRTFTAFVQNKTKDLDIMF